MVLNNVKSNTRDRPNMLVKEKNMYIYVGIGVMFLVLRTIEKGKVYISCTQLKADIHSYPIVPNNNIEISLLKITASKTLSLFKIRLYGTSSIQ